MADKFMFFDNFKETADKLPDDLRLKFYDAMTDYVFKGIEPDDVIIGALITAIKPSLDKEEKRGGNHNPTGQNQYSEVKKEVKVIKVGQSGQSFLETETETEKDNLKVIQKEPAKKFVKPTIDEVKAYCLERNNGVDAERWFDWYEANGWRSGKNPMKDWRAAVRTWERGSENSKPASGRNSGEFSDIIQRTPEQEEESRKMALMVEATKKALAEKMRLKFGA